MIIQADRDWWADWMAETYGPTHPDVVAIRSGERDNAKALSMIARHRETCAGVTKLLNVEFVETRPSDECGCPEEEWLIGGVTLTIHAEPDDSLHAHLDAGDWDAEIFFSDAPTLDLIRPRVFDWAHGVIMYGAQS